MKRSLMVGLSLLAVAAAIPAMGSTPVLSNLQQAGSSIVKNLMQPKVELNLGAEKKVMAMDTQGKPQVTWQSLKGEVAVQPGDVLRYTLTSENAGDKPAKDLALTQPVPAKTTYVLGSALANGATLTFSIDGGQTFVDKPMIKVKLADGKEELRPAPAEAYTHVRWDYSESLAPLAA
ncbi:MAG: hypothetical protein WCD18_12010, partial [Thermosynechococcaceae cyanobacterium]